MIGRGNNIFWGNVLTYNLHSFRIWIRGRRGLNTKYALYPHFWGLYMYIRHLQPTPDPTTIFQVDTCTCSCSALFQNILQNLNHVTQKNNWMHSQSIWLLYQHDFEIINNFNFKQLSGSIYIYMRSSAELLSMDMISVPIPRHLLRWEHGLAAF